MVQKKNNKKKHAKRTNKRKIRYTKDTKKYKTQSKKGEKMKEISLYKCDICGTEFKEKDRCMACERVHKQVKKIAGARYLPITGDETGYPDRITVEFEDGETKVYKR